MQKNDRLDLQLFARRGGRNYMMRSEKRPSYNHPQPEPRPRRRKTRYGYIILTLLVSILLWPVGLFLIWNRRLRCGVGGKLLWSAATLAVCCGLVVALLTVPTGNAGFQRFQDSANDFFDTAGADISVAWDTFSERAGDAFGNMRSVACSVGNFALNKAADGIDAGVEVGRDVRSWLGGLFPAEDGQAPASEAGPSPSPAGDDTAASPSAAATVPAGESPSPEPLGAPTPSASDAPEAQEEAARQLIVSGMALIQSALDGTPSVPAGTSPAQGQPLGATRPPSGNGGDAESAEATEVPEISETPDAPATPEETEVPAPSETAGLVASPTPTAAPSLGATPSPEADAEETGVGNRPRVTPQPARAMPTPTPEAEAPLTGPVVAKGAGEFTVYHTDHGRYYHTTETCSGMLGAGPHTLASSVEDGFEACPVCDAPAAGLLEAEDAAWVDEDSVYHTSDECPSFAGEGARLMTAGEAEEMGCIPCAACGANTLRTLVPELGEEELLELAKDVAVYFYDGSRGYHAESSCYGMSGAPERTLYEAIEMDKPPCSRCNPPTLEDLG